MDDDSIRALSMVSSSHTASCKCNSKIKREVDWQQAYRGLDIQVRLSNPIQSTMSVARTNDDKLLRVLLSDSRFSCTRAINQALPRTQALGRMDLVTLLLSDNRCHPDALQGVRNALKSI